jgi:hypothetical protein
VILVAAVLLGGFGFQLLVTLTLPHLALQMSIYSLWLLGGGGAIFGWVLGLFVAGIVLGPTATCALLCPTGALFSLLGRARVFRLQITEPSNCPRTCHLCDLNCWLELNPASGDPGPDCDLCTRCSQVCPERNLQVGLGQGKLKELPVVGLGALVLCGLAFSPPAHALAGKGGEPRPRLIVDEHRDMDGVNVAVGIADLSRVRLAADDARTEGGVEFSVRLTRGARGPDDAMGRMGKKEHYAGPLTIALVDRSGKVLAEESFEKPNQPISTINRKIYRKRAPVTLNPGDALVIKGAQGWLNGDVSFVVPEMRPGKSASDFWSYLLGGFLVALGLLSLAMVWGNRPAATAKEET